MEQLTLEQKILATVGLLSNTAAQVAAGFGHTNIGNAINEYASLAPVFAGIFDSIHSLFKHQAAVQAATTVVGQQAQPAVAVAKAA